MCELLVGLPNVNVLEVVETNDGLRAKIETRSVRPSCGGCGGPARVKGRRDVEHADLPCFGRPTVLVWRKIRWQCSVGCGARSFTETAGSIAAPRQRLADRAGRWATVQVGRRGRPVTDVTGELGAGWDPVMDAVVAYGQVLIDDPGRFADVEAIGLDETLRCRTGKWKACPANRVYLTLLPTRPGLFRLTVGAGLGSLAIQHDPHRRHPQPPPLQRCHHLDDLPRRLVTILPWPAREAGDELRPHPPGRR